MTNSPIPSVPSQQNPDAFSLKELKDIWLILSPSEKVEGMTSIPHYDAEEFFLQMSAADKAEFILELPPPDRRVWARLLPPDDATDMLQAMGKHARIQILEQLDDQTRKEVTALLAYAEDHAGGLMNPRYARIRPEMSLDEAITYLKKQTRSQIESFFYIYVLDHEQHLCGVVSFRDLFLGQSDQKVEDIMRRQVVKALDTMDQEALGKLFSEYSYLAIPVVDAQNHLKGIVTADDILDVVTEEATEDFQKIGGMEALDAPYLKTGFIDLIKKRGGWLAILFLGEMLTATAMGFFQGEIAKAVVLALFVPLIISSGGNSGSQASTLVIRALALGEIRLRDWWRVINREIASGLLLGTFLGAIGFSRILIWQLLFHPYGEHFLLIGFTVFGSLIGVVSFGTIMGSMLPFILKKAKLDPASASAPFVATLVDVTGLIIYFSVASLLLKGTLL